MAPSHNRGACPEALVGGGDGTDSGAARNGEGARLAGFDIAENMFYMFSAMPFEERLSSKPGHATTGTTRVQAQNRTTSTSGRISAISRIAEPLGRTP